MATPAIGIDLGTTNTVISVVRDGTPIVIPDETGATLLPSVVSFHPNGGALVGARARERRFIDPDNTIFSVKRLIGRRWETPEVEQAQAYFPFKLKRGADGLALVVARGNAYALPTISSLVLRRAKRIAERFLGTEVNRAVITVPAAFNDLQRASTKTAAEESGLEVLRVLNEPTAAAVAYGLDATTGVSTAGGVKRIAVYDLGGGTFDLTLLEFSGNVIEVLGTAGDSFLGGDDMDSLVLGQMVFSVLEQTRFDPRGDRSLMARLRLTAEQVKISLSSREAAEVELKNLTMVDGVPISAKFSMKRAEINSLAKPLVDKSIDVCNTALGIAKLSASSFDHVVLVGGATRMPLVKQTIAAHFGREPLCHVNPDEVVAVGAANHANSLTESEQTCPSLRAAPIVPRAAKWGALPPPSITTTDPVDDVERDGSPETPYQERESTYSGEAFERDHQEPSMFAPLPSVWPSLPKRTAMLLVDVTSHTLAVQTVGGFVDSIIDRNTSIPCSETRTFSTAFDNQTEVAIRVCQGEAKSFAENAAIGELVLSGVRPARRGEIAIDVTFELDADGMLQVRARENGSSREVVAKMHIDLRTGK